MFNTFYLYINMQQEREEIKLKNGAKEPFEGGREKFAKIPKAQRSEYIKKILLEEQLPIPPPFIHQKQFPSESKMQYFGHSLHYYSIQNTESPKAILVMIHGVNSNGGTFGYLADRIAHKNKQVNIYAYDQINFGQSGGQVRGLIASLEDSAKEAQTFIDFLISKYEKKPKVFLCGHSYGGAITIKLTLMIPNVFSGMILLAPALKDLDESFYYAKRVMKFIGWLFPRYRINKSAPPGLGTKYNLKEKFLNDPLIFTDGIMPGTIRSAINASAQIHASLEQVITPFLCLAPQFEKLVDPFGPLDLQERSRAEDKRVVYCEGMWHVVTQEEEIDGIAWHCAKWLYQRVQ